jgi:hypothetical protein
MQIGTARRGRRTRRVLAAERAARGLSARTARRGVGLVVVRVQSLLGSPDIPGAGGATPTRQLGMKREDGGFLQNKRNYNSVHD